jgi:uncharacterized SAM-binding protein YcdF (DUF218 family)
VAQVEERIVPPNHEIICRTLRLRGVPEDKITILEGQTSSTFGDIGALAEFLDSSPGDRVLIVTDNFHTRRARWVAARVLGDRLEQVSFVSAPVDEFRPDNWWQSDLGFKMIVGEYLKFAYYIVRYGTFLYWAIPFTGLVMSAVIYSRHRAQAGSHRSPPRGAAACLD